MLQKHTVCKEGEVLTPEQANILVSYILLKLEVIGKRDRTGKNYRCIPAIICWSCG